MDSRNTNDTQFENKHCLLCYDDFTIEVFVKYRQTDESEWKPFEYCNNCLISLLEMQWNSYIKGLRNADCEASLRQSIECGAPTNFRDSRINDGNEIYQFVCNNVIISGKLQNSLDSDKTKLLNSKLKGVLPLLGGGIGTSLNDSATTESFDYIGYVDKILREFEL